MESKRKMINSTQKDERWEIRKNWAEKKMKDYELKNKKAEDSWDQ